jgi:LacI family transcriptional regulator
MSETGEKRATLRSLAEITGLGISTVSQALRDAPDISEETKRRVRLAAQAAGYRPNRAGVRLRTGKTNVIALILNAQDGGSGFTANFILGISESLSGTQYHMVVTPYSLSDPMAPVRYLVETGSADGVIISRTQPDDPRVRYLTDNNMPFASHGRTDMGVRHAFFDYDNGAFASNAVGILAAKGRKRIALLPPPSMLSYFHHTLGGFDKGLQGNKIVGYMLANVNSDSSLDAVREAAFAASQRSDRPDGMVCTSSTMALALVAGMEQGGLLLGRDFDVVTKPVTDVVRMARPEIIMLDEDFRQAGFELGRMVMARIAGTDPIVLQKLDCSQFR